METIKCTRDDGSVVAVFETYVDDEGKRFIKTSIVEDSDWLHIDDMQLVAVHLNMLIMKLQYQDIKDS